MENQHRKIKGYRELTQEEIDLMNEIKQKGKELEAMCDSLRNMTSEISESEEGGKLVRESEAFRWLSIGRTHLQQGIMAVTRAVAKPEFF